MQNRAQELCERRGGRPGLPVPNKPYGFCGRKATLNSNCARQSSGAVCESRSDSLSLISLMVSVDVKQHSTSSKVREEPV